MNKAVPNSGVFRLYRRVHHSLLFLILLFPAFAQAIPYQMGFCKVAEHVAANDEPCLSYRGLSQTGLAVGETVEVCNEAKAIAKKNLLLSVPAKCGVYVRCEKSCRNVKNWKSPQ